MSSTQGALPLLSVRKVERSTAPSSWVRQPVPPPQPRPPPSGTAPNRTESEPPPGTAAASAATETSAAERLEHGELGAALRRAVVSPLLLACKRDDQAAFERAIADIRGHPDEEERRNALEWTDRNCRTALFYAAARGNEPFVSELLRAGADPAVRARVHRRSLTALEVSALRGHVEVVRTLIEGGAPGSYKVLGRLRGLGQGPLDPDVCRLVLGKWPPPPGQEAVVMSGIDAAMPAGGAAGSASSAGGAAGGVGGGAAGGGGGGGGGHVGPPGVHDMTMLAHAAAKRNDVAALRALADGHSRAAVHTLVNQRDRNGSTPLFHCAWSGRVDVAVALLDLGADINVRNLRGNSALHLAVEKSHEPLVRLLLQRGADTRDVSVREIRKRTGRKISAKVSKLIKSYPPLTDKQKELMRIYQTAEKPVAAVVRSARTGSLHVADVRAVRQMRAAAALHGQRGDEGGEKGEGEGGAFRMVVDSAADGDGTAELRSARGSGGLLGSPVSTLPRLSAIVRASGAESARETGPVSLSWAQMGRLAMGLPADRPRNTRRRLASLLASDPHGNAAAREGGGKGLDDTENSDDDIVDDDDDDGGGGGDGKNNDGTDAPRRHASSVRILRLPLSKWTNADVLEWLRTVAQQWQEYDLGAFAEPFARMSVTGKNLLTWTEQSLQSDLEAHRTSDPSCARAPTLPRWCGPPAQRHLWRMVFRLQQEDALRRLKKHSHRSSVIDHVEAQDRLERQQKRQEARAAKKKGQELARLQKQQQLRKDAQQQHDEEDDDDDDSSSTSAPSLQDPSSAKPSPPQSPPQSPARLPRGMPVSLGLSPRRPSLTPYCTPVVAGCAAPAPPLGRRPSALSTSPRTASLVSPPPDGGEDAPVVRRMTSGGQDLDRLVADALGPELLAVAKGSAAGGGAPASGSATTGAHAQLMAQKQVEENQRLARLSQQLASLRAHTSAAKKNQTPRRVRKKELEDKVAALHRGQGAAVRVLAVGRGRRRESVVAVDDGANSSDDDEDEDDEDDSSDSDDSLDDPDGQGKSDGGGDPDPKRRFDARLEPRKNPLSDEHRAKLTWIWEDVDKMGRGWLEREDLLRLFLFIHPTEGHESADAEVKKLTSLAAPNKPDGTVTFAEWTRAWRLVAESGGGSALIGELIDDYATALERAAPRRPSIRKFDREPPRLPPVRQELGIERHRRILSSHLEQQ